MSYTSIDLRETGSKKKITKSNLVCPVNAGRSFVPVWLSSVPTLVADQKLAYV